MNENIVIPHIDFQAYENSFLQNTMFVVSYDEVTEKALSGDFSEKKVDFFNRYFGINQRDRDFIKDGIAISSSNQSLRLIFTKDHCLINVNRSAYKSFVESVLPHIFEISLFLKKVVLLQEAKSISVRKINLFPVIADKSMDLSLRIERQKLLGNVLSTDLMQLHHETSTIEVRNAVHPFGQRVINNRDGCIYTLKTGILRLPNKKNEYVVVLDMTAQVQPIIGTDNMETIAVTLNERLYDLYHWAVVPEISKLQYGRFEK